MKALVQRVSRASVSVNDKIVGKIGWRLVVFLGVAQGDSKEDASYLANKVANLRIFADEPSLICYSLAT
jgi:D-tyrosyl-tRNA(Tyr) deacylase